MTVLPFPKKSDAWPGLSADAVDFIERAVPQETTRGYLSDWRHWCIWLERRGKEEAQATDEDLANYLAGLGKRRFAIATIRRRRAGIEAIRKERRQLRLSGPNTRAVVGAMARVLGDSPRRAKPLTGPLLLQVVDAIGRRAPLDRRDRALFLAMWQAALRSGEASALNWRDFTEALPLGGSLLLRNAKGSRDGRPQRVKLMAEREDCCPVRALLLWRRSAKDIAPAAPVFTAAHRDLHGRIRMTDRRMAARSITGILRQRMVAARLDPEGFSSHSFRAGFATSAANADVNPWHLREHMRHRNIEVMADYVRTKTELHDHPAKGLL